MSGTTSEAGRVERSPHNRLGLDYWREAENFARFPRPIIDAHTHLHGATACRIYAEVAARYGVGLTYTMTQLRYAPEVREALGDRVRFISIPSWAETDRVHAHGAGYVETVERFRAEFDARVMKIWNAPRIRELTPGASDELWRLDSTWRVRACEAAQRLGMMFMAHVADPDTWFATKYRDASIYETKRDHYAPFERMLDRFGSPWIGAHMGGWPEDLAFLDGMLSRHPNLYLDTSATKWMVRELSRHSREEFSAFMEKWRGRVLFGTDIVTLEDHVTPEKVGVLGPKSQQASSPEAARELYASRFWALRRLLEGEGDVESPIADEDLMMVDPERHDAMSAPMLRGFGLKRDVLESLYYGAASTLFSSWEAGTWRPAP